MSIRHTRCTIHLVCLFCILIAALTPSPTATAQSTTERALLNPGIIYRTTVTLATAADHARVAKLSLAILDMDTTTADLLVDGKQLASLARLSFQPRDTERLDRLASAQGSTELTRSLRLLLAQSALIQQRIASSPATIDSATALRASVTLLTPDQRVGIAALPQSDDDADGLSNQEEEWWCTNPQRTDSDFDGKSDGIEINQLRQGNSTNGPPFQGWPVSSTSTTCTDRDEDSIPDIGEMTLGLNTDRETTDGDKFDDGQELFGITRYPGYGALPRAEDTFITANMPGWVDPPGDSPFVAAYPHISIDIIPNSLRIGIATIIDVGRVISVGETYSRGTSETTGVSVGVGRTETHTTQEWMETGNSIADSYERSHYEGQMTSAYQQFARAYSIGSSVDTEFGNQQTVTTTDSESIGSKFNSRIGSELSGVLECTLRLRCIDLKASVGAKISGDISKEESEERRREIERIRSNSWNVKQHVSRNDSGSFMAGSEISRESGDTFTVSRINESSTTHGTGREHSVATTVTREEYEEQTVSQEHQIATGQEWSRATAVNTSHAANLRFQYRFRNTGTDYAQRIDNILFNIYIGQDPVAISAYASVVSGNTCVQAIITDRYPGDFYPDSGNATQCNVPLSLEQLGAIDSGAPIRIVAADYRYGDEQRFYENAWTKGVIVDIDDGHADGDSTIDSYLIPTWDQETYQDVLKRYFREFEEESNGRVRAIRTPEYDLNHKISGWNWHSISDSSWWSVYLSSFEDSVVPFHERGAVAESRIFMRFDADADADGYSDRTEEQFDTNPQDVRSFPGVGLVAGYTETRQGNIVTVQMVFENFGKDDAVGVEARLFAPDTTVQPETHLLGGAGRVPAGRRISLGARVGKPGVASWDGTAQPVAGGQYTGGTNRIFTFEALAQGTVGQNAGLQLAWRDGTGRTGILDIGEGYRSPQPLSVADGLQIGLGSGDIRASQTFTVPTTISRDKFTYTIKNQSYTPPRIVVSYNDPQGNHTFVTPIKLTNLSDNLFPYRASMLPDPTLEIASSRAFAPGENRNTFVFNNPLNVPIKNAFALLGIATPEGEVVATKTLSVTLQPGPNLVPVIWNTSEFSPAYDSAIDYKLVGYVTDWSHVVIDTDLRYLSELRKDPTPRFNTATPDATWNFGTVTKGDILNRSFTFGNTGPVDLLTYAIPASGTTISGGLSRRVTPGDTTTYPVIIDTSNLLVGAYDRTITMRTSDSAYATRPIRIIGTITALAEGAFARPVENRPWHRSVWVPGSHQQNDPIDFAHRITTDPAEVEPVYLYDQTRTRLLGTGEALPIGLSSGALPSAVFGDGSDGNFGGGDPNGVRVALSSNVYAGQPTIPVMDSSGFTVGQELLIIQMQGTGAGTYEFGMITEKGSGYLTLRTNLTNSYHQDSVSRTQVLWVPHFADVSGSVTTSEWNGSTGGIVAFRARNIDSVFVDVSVKGFKGGYGNDSVGAFCQSKYGQQGNSFSGTGNCSQAANGGGGGGGANRHNADFGSGGGGAYGTTGGYGVGPSPGANGNSYGSPDLSTMFLGSGGGGGHWGSNPYGGGRNSIQGNDWSGQGAGVAFIAARTITNLHVYANGNAGGHSNVGSGGYGGGGGSGGSINIIGGNISNLGTVQALGGAGGIGRSANGGNGGVGRINIVYGVIPADWATSPTANSKQVKLFSMEKVSDSHVRLTLPESFPNGRTYSMLFGQRHQYNAAGDHIFHVRMNKTRYASASLDAIVSGVASVPYTLCLDVGNDGGTTNGCDWQQTIGDTTSLKLTSPNLAAFLNTYRSRATTEPDGTMIVPIRVRLSAPGTLILTNLAAVSAPDVDLQITPTDMTFTSATPVEGSDVRINTRILNVGKSRGGPFTVAFFATPDGGQEQLIGSGFVGSINAQSVTSLSLLWNTSGYTGTVKIRVVLDPFNRVLESVEGNNQVSKTIVVQTRPDLRVSAITLSDNEPIAGKSVVVQVAVRNAGQSTAPAYTTTVYRGDPASNGVPPADLAFPELLGGATLTKTMTWTPSTHGMIQLMARADSANVVSEMLETNNTTSRSVNVGLRSPIVIDSGKSDADPIYTSTRGYGAVDHGEPDILRGCGTASEQTYRLDPSGSIGYRFDALQPGHRYHLDLVLYECGQNTGRIQSISVDGRVMKQAVNVGSGGVQPVSLLLSPADYQDRTITVQITSTSQYGALVNAIALYDIGYWYADAGGSAATDSAYSATRGYGWLNGTSTQSAGTLPYQTARINLVGNEVVYQFDNLGPTKQYRLNTSYFHNENVTVIQQIVIDDQNIGLPFNVPKGQSIPIARMVPTAAYATDQSITVKIRRTNGSIGALVNELTLEEVTQIP